MRTCCRPYNLIWDAITTSKAEFCRRGASVRSVSLPPSDSSQTAFLKLLHARSLWHTEYAIRTDRNQSQSPSTCLPTTMFNAALARYQHGTIGCTLRTGGPASIKMQRAGSLTRHTERIQRHHLRQPLNGRRGVCVAAAQQMLVRTGGARLSSCPLPTVRGPHAVLLLDVDE